MDIHELYQELLIDHGTHPRNCCALPTATHEADGFNPLCGDKIHVYVEINNNRVENIRFEGQGCAISTASASLMTESLQHKSITECEQLFNTFQHALTDTPTSDLPDLGKLTALFGVRAFPVRVKCATLAWHTLKAALQQQNKPVSTE